MEVSEMEERKIGQIKEELKAATEAMLPSFIMAYESDERSGVIKLVEQGKKRLAEIRGRTKKNLETAGIRTKIWSVHLYLWD
jgi:hypothetical protein